MISTNLSQPNASQAVLKCDSVRLRYLMMAALVWLEQHAEQINALNVFPVPDGDTGTNMLLTLRAAVAAIAHEERTAIGDVAAKLAYGALHGSRGNSGTALSQLLSGIAEVLRGAAELDASLLVRAFRRAVEVAYATFPKPVEGTILTVARAVSEAVARAAEQTDDLRRIFLAGLEGGRQALAETPRLLPILAQAGVVDSGGQGLIVIMEGMARLFDDQSGMTTSLTMPMALSAESLDAAFALSEEASQDGFGYDVQYMLYGENLDVDAIRAAISAMGASPIVVGTPEAVKVHVHVPDPSVPLAYGESLGRLSEVVVENMQAQSDAYRAARLVASHSAEIAVISVAYGEGIGQVFRDLGARLLSGGQTMNPSVGEFLDAMRAANAAQVILLPNNPNVLVTAQQAAKLAERELGCRVAVVPTRSLPQGIAAMIAWQADGDFEAVCAAMHDAAQQVRTGEVTTATREASLNGLHIHSGQIIGLLDDQLVSAGDSVERVLCDVLAQAQAERYEVITLYYGNLVTVPEAELAAETVRQHYPQQEVTLLYGGQPYYHYIISVE
ncbi:MAG: DAK2 domain-containing protein [Anaerolineae bacterium]|nr:DAK2 domain-containing protein [Anaerolineae bacterium]